MLLQPPRRKMAINAVRRGHFFELPRLRKAQKSRSPVPSRFSVLLARAMAADDRRRAVIANHGSVGGHGRGRDHGAARGATGISSTVVANNRAGGCRAGPVVADDHGRRAMIADYRPVVARRGGGSDDR